MNNNIELHYVNYDFAKFLKSKGFNVPCKQAFYGDVEDEDIEYNEPTTTGDDFILGEYDCYAPEHWEVVDWLNLNHGIWVSVNLEEATNEDSTLKFHFTCHRISDNSKYWISGVFDTPQEAYSAAFDYIKDNNLI